MISLCLHNWSKWTEPYIITVRRPDKWGDSYDAEITIQDRTRAKCNKVQERVIFWGVVSEKVE